MRYVLTVDDHLELEPVVTSHEDLEGAQHAAVAAADAMGGLTVVSRLTRAGGRFGLDYVYLERGQFIDRAEEDIPWADYRIEFDAGTPGGI